MITLYTGLPLWGLPSMNVAGMKLETWLRIAKLPYKAVVASVQDYAASPKRKIPFIGYKGRLVGDSTLIIEMLKQEEGIDLDANLTTTERAISLAFRRMIKENTYWGIIHIRWSVEENWQRYREVLASHLFTETSAEESEPFIDGIRKIFLSQMYAHGIGRHRNEEIVQIICADFQALSDFLAGKPFFMGEQPTTLDATAYAYVGNVIKPPYISPIVDYVLQRSNLCQHYERMTQQFFVDSALEH